MLILIIVLILLFGGGAGTTVIRAGVPVEGLVSDWEQYC
jgi:hypothetical protein